MDIDYIIVQAGGKGSRMRQLTQNKPKALVPVNNLPMIFHLFSLFPNACFIVIGDYKYDVLNRYLKAFAKVKYKLVCATGGNGTCSGIKKALSFIPNNKRFMLIWCDLILPSEYKIPCSKNNIIGISGDFPCRWSYKNNNFIEERSSKHGVAGHFIFNSKSYIIDVPEEGEFVKWLQTKGLTFEEQILSKTHEYGLIEEWDKLPKARCRPFNKLEIKKNKIYKIPIDDQGKVLNKREVNWYKTIKKTNSIKTPKIYSYDPFCMEKINGKNVYEYVNISDNLKRDILIKIVHNLKRLHSVNSIPSNKKSYANAYLNKTFERLSKVKDLVPFANNRTININGKKCRNIFYNVGKIKKMIMHYFPKSFTLIHGDCTFSNILIDKDNDPVFIDPRGYFGINELYGDPAYDWVKLYYSIISNYDQFNLKRFKLDICKNEVKLYINSNGWENLEEIFFESIGEEISKKQMKLFLAITWLSLTTYAWEDYDSICGAFYNGLYYLEEAFHE